jgi:hypothetical protein
VLPSIVSAILLAKPGPRSATGQDFRPVKVVPSNASTPGNLPLQRNN